MSNKQLVEEINRCIRLGDDPDMPTFEKERLARQRQDLENQLELTQFQVDISNSHSRNLGTWRDVEQAYQRYVSSSKGRRVFVLDEDFEYLELKAEALGIELYNIKKNINLTQI